MFKQGLRIVSSCFCHCRLAHFHTCYIHSHSSLRLGWLSNRPSARAQKLPPRFTLFVLVFGFGEGKLAHAVVRLKWVVAELSQILEVVQRFPRTLTNKGKNSRFSHSIAKEVIYPANTAQNRVRNKHNRSTKKTA